MPHSLWRNLFSFFSKRVLGYVMGVKTIRDIGAFRAFRTDLRKAFENYRNPNVLVDVLLSWGTGRFAVVHVDQEPRHQGKSNYTFSKLAKAAMLILTGFSTAPLRFTSLIGFSFTLFGICVLIYVLGVYFFQGSIPGFPFLASLIAMFSGAQLFALGIIGEYLARVFDYSMQRPAYTIAEVTQSADPSVEQPAQPGNGTHAA
ncbi:MAG TPA: hypothetical protein VHO48_10995 [Anaerolineaceae bacterium]|nr:hypothetical protein [Anaerolineaceae bacterium]